MGSITTIVLLRLYLGGYITLVVSLIILLRRYHHRGDEEEAVYPVLAVFNISEFIVWPQSVEAGESVTVQVLVSNVGYKEGTYNLVLKVNGEREAEESVPIAPGNTQRITFSLTKKEPGSNIIVVDGLSSSFNVLSQTPQQQTPVPETPPQAPPQTAPPQIPEVSLTLEESLLVQVTPATPSNMFTICISIGISVTVGLLAFLLLKGRVGKY